MPDLELQTYQKHKNMKKEHNLQTAETQILNIPIVSEFFILCDCNSEALLLKRFVDDHDKEIYLSIYTTGQFQKKPNIWRRLKYCWYHLKTGKKYEDQMILNFEKAQQVSEWLSLNAR